MKVNQTSKKAPWGQKASDKLGKIICSSCQKGRIPLLYTKLLEIEEEKTINLIEKDGRKTRMRGPQRTLKHMQKWSTVFKIGEIQIKTSLGYSDLPDRLAKIQHTLLVNSWWNKTFSSVVAETANPLGAASTGYEISKFSSLRSHIWPLGIYPLLHQCEMARPQAYGSPNSTCNSERWQEQTTIRWEGAG